MTVPSSPLATLIRDMIRREGPMSIAHYMGLALGHPVHGYYMKQDPLGRAGDFITAPEISQMFGELIGLWVADLWSRAGAPDPVHIIELGPGRGTLMADMLRALRVVPGMAEAVTIHLVEISPTLKARQKAAIAPHKASNTVQWHATLRAALDAARGATMVIANEFLDALPIRQFVRTDDGWRERLVGLADDGEQSPFRTVLAPSPSPMTTLIPADVGRAPPGSIMEICPAALEVVGDLGTHLKTWGGAALMIDYGHGDSAVGDTFQAMVNHSYADPFSDPGNADLTAHVDFGAVRRAGLDAGLNVAGPVTQGRFLTSLGIDARASRLANAAPAKADAIGAAHRRLVDDDAMGRLFKVMALTSPEWPQPAAFDPS